MQFAAIKQRHNKELLVVMREATEGSNFDAIIESEYRGIGDDDNVLARRLYLIVCCFYQHGAHIRADLLSRLGGIGIVEMYDLLNEQAEGVIIFDEIDALGNYAARARHRTIAAVVWDRCGETSERDDILQQALSNLNLTYRIDKEAFEDFYRSDRLVDSLSTLEKRINYFKLLVEKTLIARLCQHFIQCLNAPNNICLRLLKLS